MSTEALESKKKSEVGAEKRTQLYKGWVNGKPQKKELSKVVLVGGSA